MTIILVPFHQDERLADDDLPVPAGGRRVLVDPPLPPVGIWQRLAAVGSATADAVAEAVADAVAGGLPGVDGPVGVVSGDCMVALGTLAGVQRAGVDASLVWFDAHADLHTMASSTSGYLGGMVLRMALGADAERIVQPLGVRPLTEDQAVLVDARDIDPAEQEFLLDSRVRLLRVAETTPDLLGTGPLVVHVDLDVIDAAQLPGLRFPVGGGPGRDEVVAAVRRLIDSGRVIALDLACPWHPARHPAQAQARAELLAELLG